jgi:hypothetical protein
MHAVGTATMEVAMTIDKVPTATGGSRSPPWLLESPAFPRPGCMAIAQIKGARILPPKGGLIELRYELGRMYLMIVTSGTKLQPTEFHMLTNKDGNPANIPVGAAFTYKMVRVWRWKGACVAL